MARIFLLGSIVVALALYAVDAEEVVTKVTKEGDCNTKAKNGDTVSVHYVGKLDDANGKEFDASRPRGEPLDLELGSGMVIQGWEKGILGMCLGEVRELTIPPSLGYGEQGYPPVIPAKATLHFEVEIMKISPGASSDEL